MIDGGRILIGWEEIAKLTPFTAQTVMRKFGQEMFSCGVVFKSKLGSSKQVRVWSYRWRIEKFLVLKSLKHGKKGWV